MGCQCCRSTLVLADADREALGVPDLAANEVLSEGVVRLRLAGAPGAAGDAVGVVGDVLPVLLESLGRAVGVEADPDGRVPRAADAAARSGVDSPPAVEVAEVFDALVDPVSASEVAETAVGAGDPSVAPVAGLEAGVGGAEVVVRVDLVDLLRDLLDGPVEGEDLALGAEGTREGGLLDIVALGDEVGFHAEAVDVAVGVNRSGRSRSL